MKTKEITVELKLVAQPKQYQSLTVGVSTTVELHPEDFDVCSEPAEDIKAAIRKIRGELSQALTEGIYEEIKKLYGEPAARAALVAYFGQQGGQV